MAKKSVKQIVNSAKTRFKNMGNATKRRIGAGVLAGSLFFAGLTGCSQANLNDTNDRVDAGIVENVGDNEVQTNPILDQTINEQLASVVSRLTQILENQGVSEERINELVDRVNACSTEEEMLNALNVMQAQIEKYVSEELDKKLAELESSLSQLQQPTQKPENGNIQFGSVIDLNEINSALKQMAFDIEVGNRTDYHTMFVEAERLERILNDTNAELDQAKLAKVKGQIKSVQAVSLYLITQNAVEVEQNKTGCIRLDIEENSSASGAGSGFLAIDKAGRIAQISSVESDGSIVGVVQDGVIKVLEEGEYGEDVVGKEEMKYYCDSYATELLCGSRKGNFYGEVDFSYNVIDGYTVTVSNENINVNNAGQEVTVKSEERRSIKLDKDGGIDNVKVAYSNTQQQIEGVDGAIVSTVRRESNIELDSISKEEMDKLIKQATQILEDAKQNGEEAEQ